ncbi:hypothetical protein GX48_07149 [Paracoccidioides brasiliensis]|nr:hypothetical protein GX48_07149 [Paracoccidioides brasiliensis]
MGVSPAYLQPKDYDPLAPGDWVIQTPATGTIAHFVCQFARLFGAKVILLSEEELDSTSEREEKRISLALDSVFKKERPNSKRHFSSGLPSWVAFSAEPGIRNHKKQERNPNLSRPHKAQKLMASAFSPSDPSPPPRGEDLGLNPSRPPKHYSTGP